jgi:hypothetical protein
MSTQEIKREFNMRDRRSGGSCFFLKPVSTCVPPNPPRSAESDGQEDAGLVSPIEVALVALGPRDTATALTRFEEAYAARAPRLININDPFFSDLTGEPRYRQLLSRLGLPSGTY